MSAGSDASSSSTGVSLCGGPEESAGPGVEQTMNGSFELGEQDWGYTISYETVQGAFCKCWKAQLKLDGSVATLTTVFINDSIAVGQKVHAQARIFAPDSVNATLSIMAYDETYTLPSPVVFQSDAADAEGVDGWRLAHGDWTAPMAIDIAKLVITFDGSAGTFVGVDCVSATREP
jgi:hypothetical protein